MPLQLQPLVLQFAGGVETRQDSKQVPTTRLLTLENGTFIKQTTIAKRNGYEALSRLVDEQGTEYGTPVGLANRGDELLLFTAERCYSHRPSTDRWVDTGEVASVHATETPIGRTGTQQTMPDHATKGGVTVLAWEDSRGGVYISVVESVSGRIMLAETQMDSLGQSPRCVPCGTVLHVYWTQPTTSRIYVAIVNPAAPSGAPTPAILVDDLSSTNACYDACDAGPLYPSILPAAMVWADTLGGYRVGYVHPSGVLGSPVTGLPSVATWAETVTGPVAIAVDRTGGSQLAVSYANTQPWVRMHNTSALLTSSGQGRQSLTSGTWNRLSLEFDGSGGGWWVGEIDAATDDKNGVECVDFDATGAAIHDTRVVRGHGLLSRAFYDNGDIYAILGHAPQFFTYAVCVRISADIFGAKAAGGAAFIIGTTTVGPPCVQAFYRSIVTQLPGLPTRKHVASVQPISPDASGLSRNHATTIGYRIQVDSSAGDQFGEQGIKLVSLDFDAESAYQSAQLGRGLYLAGSCPQHYDGRKWAEAGFHTAPDVVNGTVIAAEGAAGAIGAGVYGYKLVYEEIDALGELHRGPTSVEINVTIAASKKIDLTIPTYRLTNKRRVRIGVFRSPVNQTGDPASIPFYRVSSIDPEAVGDNGYVLNDPTVDTIAFVDNIDDAVLITKEPLYTNGGILSNIPAPMRGDVITNGKSRLFWTDVESGQLMRYSQEIADETGLESPVVLSQKNDPYGGRLVGIGVMDGAVFGFCETAIYGFGGPGPLANPSASQDAFSVPELITSDVGCKSPNSICQSPVGIVFQSEKGIKLLTRTRDVKDIGAPVYAYNNQTITRATLLPDRHQIVFLTDAGVTLLYNYGAGENDPSAGQWSTFTNHEGIDARVIGGVYHYLRTDGRVFRETPGAYLDDNAQIKLVIETAWIHFAPYFQAWQRVLWAYFLGTYKSAHMLVVRYRIDDNPGYSPPISLDVNSNYNPDIYGTGTYGAGTYGGTMGDTTRYQRAIHFNVPCQAIQFRIEDSEATGAAGASFELSELLLVGGILDHRAKIGPARIQ